MSARTSVGAGAVALDDVAQFQDRVVGCDASCTSAGPLGAPMCVPSSRGEALLAQVEPAQVGLGPHHERVVHDAASAVVARRPAAAQRPAARCWSCASSAVALAGDHGEGVVGAVSTAIRTLSISSSRGGGSSAGTACHQAPSSSMPSAVMA